MLRQLLLVTEDPGLVALATEALSSGPSPAQLHLARGPVEAQALLDGGKIQLAIIDASHGELPQVAPLAQQLKAASIPTLLLTAPTGFAPNLVEGLVVVDRPSTAEALAEAVAVLLRLHVQRAG